MSLAALAVAASGVATFVVSRDEALPDALKVASGSSNVVNLVGDVKTASLSNSIYYQGVPGKEDPYREYRVRIEGPRGKADVKVRAMRRTESGPWAYEIRAVDLVQ